MSGFDELGTEAQDPAGADLDRRSTVELVELMAAVEATVPAAVAAAAPAVAALVDGVASRLAAGGRLVYAGAGTSGGLAALDAAECQATFSTPPGQVVALVAGAGLGTPLEQAAAEDDAGAGAQAAASLGLIAEDAVVAVSASGRSRYVLAVADAAREAGALTGCIVCVEGSPLGAACEREVCVPVGPEVLAGSTRLKAGTAQKLILNMLSTIAMIRLGKTYGNLMVDVAPASEKLRARARRVVRDATDASPDRLEAALAAAGGDAKTAIVTLLTGLSASEARTRLEQAGGVVRRAVDG